MFLPIIPFHRLYRRFAPEGCDNQVQVPCVPHLHINQQFKEIRGAVEDFQVGDVAGFTGDNGGQGCQSAGFVADIDADAGDVVGLAVFIPCHINPAFRGI